MNVSNVLGFSVPLAGSNSHLAFTHYCEDVKKDTTTPFSFPEFTGIVINLSGKIEYVHNAVRSEINPKQYQIVHTVPGKCDLTLKSGLHTVILIQLPADLLESIAANSVFSELLASVRNNEIYQMPLPLRLPYEVHSILDQLRRHRKGNTQEVFNQIKVTEMIILLVDHTLTPKPSKKNNDQFFLMIDKARSLMLNEMNKDWSLDLLAYATGISRKKLILGFRKYFDTSPIRYLYEERLNRAIVLLRDTTLSVNEITSKVGYRHSQNFSQAFSKKFGHPPTAYRSA
ncbi:helix-turn-helix transcriptional regulator [Dawidia soli]|uniref:Helix-turn-helix transcriptional regulator n=1 Tax=Dawidia soli TaxID=2782352 RepID=A0AAP2GIG9_9BACT|nr:helix-turn-helix transcriptional regulator [Dawidia soli]MBT1688296.1 helix-turn-helix transcriptional regulator [Dawidia soli]